MKIQNINRIEIDNYKVFVIIKDNKVKGKAIFKHTKSGACICNLYNFGYPMQAQRISGQGFDKQTACLAGLKFDDLILYDNGQGEYAGFELLEFNGYKVFEAI